MSGTVIVDPDGRQSGGQQPPDKKGPIIEAPIEEQHRTGPSPEEALAASKKAIETAEATARAATQREQQTQAELHRVRQSQQLDQAAVLASAVEASTAERDRHAQAWQQAMEAGDFPAAARHNAELAMATAKLERASGELAVLKTGTERQQQGQPQQQRAGGVSQASQEWIDGHPEFNRFAKDLIQKSNELIRSGVMVDGPRYFRELDAEYDRLAGAGGHQQQQRQQEPAHGEHRDMSNQRQFDGAPPSRGGSGGSSGRVAKTLLGPVEVRTVNGQRLLTIPQQYRGLFETGAKDCGMTLEDYTNEQVDIAYEMDAGGTGGLITSEGKTFR